MKNGYENVKESKKSFNLHEKRKCVQLSKYYLDTKMTLHMESSGRKKN